MKRNLRLISLLLCMAILLAVPVQAEPTVTPRGSCYFNHLYTSLEQTADSVFRIWFLVTASCGTKEELGASEIIVYRSSDGTNWEKMKTYYPYSRPNMMGYDTAAHSGYIVYPGTQGYYYKAYVMYYAKVSSGSGYYGHYSNVLHLLPMSN